MHKIRSVSYFLSRGLSRYGYETNAVLFHKQHGIMAHVRFDTCRVAFDTRAAGSEVDKITLRTCELLVADSGLSSVHTAV
jgi:hypothetical protein